MKKRIFSLLLIIVSFLAIVSCGTTNNEDENTGEENEPVISQITYDANGGIVGGQSKFVQDYTEGVGIPTLLSATQAGYKFLGWYLDDELVVSIPETQTGNITLVAKWEEFIITTPQTDSVTFTADYEGKDFYEDGIGVVTVVQYIDGDTTIFKTLKGHKITVRYQGIDTPESTYKVEPWGFAAANFTKEALKNAKTIVLQTEDGKPGKDNADTTNKRYLAWVWADGRLVNLDIVENGLANAKASGTQYAQQFNDAVKPVSLAKIRIYGEKDPDFDYSTGATEMSLKELRETYGTAEAINQELDKGKKIRISGVVTRKNGAASAYLQQTIINEQTGEPETYGVYLYGGYNENYKLTVGYSVIITGQIGYYSGSLQVTNVTRTNVKVQSMSDKDKISIEEVSDLYTYTMDEQKVGNIIKITTPLTITSYYDATADDSNASTLTASYKDANGVTRKTTIRIDANISLFDENGERITSGSYFQGKTFKEFTCIVGYYDPSQNDVHDGNIQLMLTLMTDIVY